MSVNAKDVNVKALETELEVRREEYEEFLQGHENRRKTPESMIRIEESIETANQMLQHLNDLQKMLDLVKQKEHEETAA